MDFFLFGPLETILLLWFGDLEAAKEGWKKNIDAWQHSEFHTARTRSPQVDKFLATTSIHVCLTVLYCTLSGYPDLTSSCYIVLRQSETAVGMSH